MKLKNILLILTGIFVLFLSQLACSSSGTATVEPGNTDAPSASATPIIKKQAPTKTPAIQVDKPEAGKASVFGQVIWNSQPVVGTDVKLCTGITYLSGCEEAGYETVTDTDGYYVLENVDPGEYVIVVKVPDSEDWVYVTTSFGVSAEKQEFLADQVTDLGIQNIIRFDLKVTSPSEEEQITQGNPTLSWDAYPEAATYSVYLSPESGSSISDETGENSFLVPTSLLNCKYTWSIKAYNKEGVQIAEVDGYKHFEVTGQQASCKVELSKPTNDAKVKAAGLAFSWEAHPLADYYLFYVLDKDYKNLIDGEKVTATTFSPADVLPAGEYQWYVNAYQDGDSIAVSPFYTITVMD